MVKMFSYYGLGILLILLGVVGIGDGVWQLLFAEVSEATSSYLAVAGVLPLTGGLFVLSRARKSRGRLEAQNRMEHLRTLAGRTSGLAVAEAARRLELPETEARRLLDGLVENGDIDIEIDDFGEPCYRVQAIRRLES